MLFDRSWYNRAGVETVMGFCTPEEHARFLRQAPIFERMLVEDGIILLKYWFSVSDEEQERRFQSRTDDPMRRWKLSPMDLASRAALGGVLAGEGRDVRLHGHPRGRAGTSSRVTTSSAARINCIHHLLTQIPYEDRTPPVLELPPRQPDQGYVRPPQNIYAHVPDHAATLH